MRMFEKKKRDLEFFNIFKLGKKEKGKATTCKM